MGTQAMSDRTELHLHEQLMLLALRDEKGTLESKATMYGYALGGAMLAELSLRGKIRIGDDKKAFVDLIDRSPLGEPVLDECLDKVANAKRRARATTWVQRFAQVKRLRHRVAQGLCRQGILRDDEDKILLFFTRRLYPTIDPVPERRLVDRLRDVIFGDSTPADDDTVIVVALANATGLLPIHFDRKDLRRRKRHLKRLTEGNMAGAAAQQAVLAAQQAAIAAVVAASSAAAVSATS